MERFTTNGNNVNVNNNSSNTNNNSKNNNNNNLSNNSNNKKRPTRVSTSSIDSSTSSSYNNININNNNNNNIKNINNINNNKQLSRDIKLNNCNNNRDTNINTRKSFPDINNVSFSSSSAGSISGSIQDDHNNDDDDDDCGLTQADLEEYSRSYYDHHPTVFHHQKQSSYAQSEGYHSYVSSSDSSSTPFLDRLRQDSEVLLSRASQWSQDIQTPQSQIINNNSNNNNNSNIISDNNSSESTSSTETLKWLGSMSDVSVASHATNTSTISGSASSQLIAHSSRVRTPQRHNSESVLYMADDQASIISSSGGSTDTLHKTGQSSSRERSSRNNHRLFPVSTYTEVPSPTTPTSPTNNDGSKLQNNHNWQSVAERISELERQHSTTKQGKQQQQNGNQKYTYLDPSKTHRVSNPTLKAFQKNAVQSYFERQQENINNNTNNNNNNNNHNSIIRSNSGSSSNLSRPQSLQLNMPLSMKTPSSRTSLPNYGSNSNLMMSPTTGIITTTTTSSTSAATTTTIKSSYFPSNQCSNLSSSNLSPVSPINSNNNNINNNNSFNNNHSHKNQINTTSNGYNNNYHHHSTSSSYNVMKNETLHYARQILPDKCNLYSANEAAMPPPPPPRNRTILPTRRTSSASEYATARDLALHSKQSLSKDLLGPMIMGPIISVDDWVPERPPKNPLLRIPSPDLPPPAIIETEVPLDNQDEPLPPPPPELLRHMRQLSSSPDSKINTASRRNSFAGSTNKKPLYRASTFDNLSPPAPQKPNPMDIMNHQRPSSSSMMAKHPHNIHKNHKVILNGKLEHPIMPSSYGRLSDSRLSLRKRTHNSHAPIELTSTKIIQPPPLKPRMPVFPEMKHFNNLGNKIRSASKASYLPRQTHDKQYQLDPDHGSYKLTLTSNEDCINQHNINNNHNHNNHNKSNHNNKNELFNNDNELIQQQQQQQKCNLPDVLPVNVKIQQTPRYVQLPQQQQQSHSAPIIVSSNSIKSMFQFQTNTNNQNTKTINNTTSSPSSLSSSSSSPSPPYSPSIRNNNNINNLNHNHHSISNNNISNNNNNNNDNNNISPKYMSQSTFDLKKTQIIEQNNFTNNEIINTQIITTTQPSKDIVDDDDVFSQENINIINTNTYNNLNNHNKLTSSRSNCDLMKKNDVIRKLSLDNQEFKTKIIDGFNCNLTQTNNNFTNNNNNQLKTIINNNNNDCVNGGNVIVNGEIKESKDIIIQTKEIKQVNEKKVEVEQEKENDEEQKHVDDKNNIENVVENCNGNGSGNNVDVQNNHNVNEMEKTDNNKLNLLENRVNNNESIELISTQISSLELKESLRNSPKVTELIIPKINEETDGLKLMQKTEIILRVNALTSEASSQTDDLLESDESNFNEHHQNNINNNKQIETKIQLTPRRRHPEEIDCEKLSKDLVNYLSPSDKLHHILAPRTFKTSSDYVTGLYNLNVTPRSIKKDASTGTCEINTTSPNSNFDCSQTNSTYFIISDPKAKQITRYNREMTLINGDSCDLTKKKEELVKRLGKKLLVLSSEQTIIAEECTSNDVLGNDVAIKVGQKVKPTDASKFRTYIDDVGHITLLLLSLSVRLARTENILHHIGDDSTEKKILEVKRDRLLEQLEEAKKLKDDIDRRGALITTILEKSLTKDEYADYDYFINMKAKLIVDSKEISDKIKLGEEQLIALKDTLVHSEC